MSGEYIRQVALQYRSVVNLARLDLDWDSTAERKNLHESLIRRVELRENIGLPEVDSIEDS